MMILNCQLKLDNVKILINKCLIGYKRDVIFKENLNKISWIGDHYIN